MSDPKLQCHKGWAQVSYAGKTVMLEDIEVGKEFILEDASIQVEALCMSKKKT
jgi:exodeoxyribonuclease VII large subunit